MREDFVIPLNGLKLGKTEFSWHCGEEFFESFGNQDILDADLVAKAAVKKAGICIEVDCSISGTVMTLCDRCADELTLPIETEAHLDVKFGEEPEREEVTVSEEGEREDVYLSEGSAGLDMGQVIYDYAILSLPMQREHEEGECNPLSLRYMSGDDTAFDGLEKNTGNDSDNPFSVLKGLLNREKE